MSLDLLPFFVRDFVGNFVDQVNMMLTLRHRKAKGVGKMSKAHNAEFPLCAFLNQFAHPSESEESPCAQRNLAPSRSSALKSLPQFLGHVYLLPA